MNKPYLYALLGLILLVAGAFRLFKSGRSVSATEEQAVIVKLKLATAPMGNEPERAGITALENRLAENIKTSNAGELDGDEYGEGFCTIYMYGPSAEKLFTAIKSSIKTFHAEPGSYLLKRYGKPGSKQDRVPLGGI